MSEVSVVIVSYRSEEAASAAARSALREPEVAGVTIVDNAAAEVSAPWRLPDGAPDRLRVIRPDRNLGYAAGNNLGIRAAIDAGTPYVLVLNPDVDLPAGAIGRLVHVLRASNAPVVSPALVEQSGRGHVELHRPGFDLALGRGLLEVPSGRRYVHTFFGAAFLARTETFERFGLLDERLFLYCEEVEFVDRLRRQGVQEVFRVASEVLVGHGRGATVSPGGYGAGERSPVAYEEAARSTIVFGKRYHPVRVPVWVAARLGLAARLVLLRDAAAARAVVRGVLRGLGASDRRGLTSARGRGPAEGIRGS